MFSRRHMLAASVAAAALAAPAAASASDSYNLSAFTFVNGTASGTDGGGWSSASKLGAEMQQIAREIPANPDGTVSEVSVPALVSVTRLKQDYALQTVAGTIAWNCAQAGELKAAPGSFELTRFGPTMTAVVTVAESLAAPRACTGFSSFTGDIDVTDGPLEATFSFPASELADGVYSKTIDTTAPCGEWTIYQTACNLRFGGSISIQRNAADTPEEEEPTPTPSPEPTPSTDLDPDVSSPPRPATPIKPKLLPGAKGATVKLRCVTACTGKVSASAAAKGKLKAKPIGSKSFSSEGGTQKVQILFGKGGSRSARQRGAVIIDVSSSGQTKSYRLNAR